MPERDDDEYDKWIAQWAKSHGTESADVDCFPDFEHAFDAPRASNAKHRWELWLHSDESCNLEQVATLVHNFFRHFKKKKAQFMVTWATTCSKMRPGEFSGGGFLVTYRKVYWMLPEQELNRIVARLKKGKKK